MLIAANYHYVRPRYDAPHPGIMGVTVEQFESQLRLLGQLGRFVGAREILQALDGDRPLPQKAIVVTFDDGLREQYVHGWAVLRRMGIPAIFFTNTRPVAEGTVSSVHKVHLLRSRTDPDRFEQMVRQTAAELGCLPDDAEVRDQAIAHYIYDTPEIAQVKYLLNFALSLEQKEALVGALFDQEFSGQEQTISRELYMGLEQLRELDAADALGSHGHEHLPLDRIPPQEVAGQVARAAELLQAWTGRVPTAMSYAHGGRTAGIRLAGQAAARSGFRFAFTMERAGNRDLEQPLFLGRFDHVDLPGGKACCWDAEQLFDQIPVRAATSEGEQIDG